MGILIMEDIVQHFRINSDMLPPKHHVFISLLQYDHFVRTN